MRRVTVYGLPQPQGSKRIGRNRSTGRAVVLDDPAGLEGWRRQLAHACRHARTGEPIDAPVAVVADFTMPRAQRDRVGDVWHARRPDVDKLARAALDSLVNAEVLVDDGRVAGLLTQTRLAGASDALEQPGLELTVLELARQTRYRLTLAAVELAA